MQQLSVDSLFRTFSQAQFHKHAYSFSAHFRGACRLPDAREKPRAGISLVAGGSQERAQRANVHRGFGGSGGLAGRNLGSLIRITGPNIANSAGDIRKDRGGWNDVGGSVQASGHEAGVDIIIVRLPRVLAGRGDLDIALTVMEKVSNPVQIQ